MFSASSAGSSAEALVSLKGTWTLFLSVCLFALWVLVDRRDIPQMFPSSWPDKLLTLVRLVWS